MARKLTAIEVIADFKALIVKAEAGDPEAMDRLMIAAKSLRRSDVREKKLEPQHAGHYGVPGMSEDVPYKSEIEGKMTVEEWRKFED